MIAEDPTDAFRIEAGELLDQVEQGLLDLGHSLKDMNLVNAVFRGLHTLKGSGAMFGFDALAAFTHHCESAFDRVRKGEVPATPQLVAVILSARDHMRGLVDGDASAGEGDAILVRLAAAVDAARGGNLCLAPVSELRQGWLLSFQLPTNAIVNGTNPLMLLDELRALGDCTVTARTDALPPLADLVPTECHLSWDVTLIGDISRQDIEDVFIFVMDDMTLSIEPLADCGAEISTDAIHSAVVPATINAGSADGIMEIKTAVWRAEESVRVPAGRLDELMDRVGELVIAQSRLSQLAHKADDLPLRAVSEEIERLSGELRDTVMVLRMVPVASLFGRFRRLIHDLARDTGKTIELVTEGETTEVDKTIMERLFDPLVHLIRNSCDHGLETSPERTSAGKPGTGTVRLSAHQAGGEVVITIRDDGRGIDRLRVRAKGEANGLIQPGQVLSDQELLQLIFAPGFSTAAAITNLSGRGVGLDVVKRTIESLRGTIDVASVDSEGSTITLRIPLTLAIIEGLLVRVGQGHYVIPLSAVEECLELSLEQDMQSRGRSMISLREQLVPYVRLREMFASDTRPDTHQKIVVVATATERVGLVVDQIVGNHQTVIKSMSPLHCNVAAFAGATILGDGSVALILEIAQLIALAQPREERLRAAG